MPRDLLWMLDQAFGNRPELARLTGRLTKLINELPLDELNKPVCPRLSIAFATSRTVEGVDQQTERRAAEIAILAHWQGGFHCNNHAMVVENGFKPSRSDIEELGKTTVEVLLRNGLIRQSDSVIDVGTGAGFIPKHLTLRGVEVEAIDPREMRDGDELVFSTTQKLTAKQYTVNYPGNRFAVVHVANFSPRPPPGKRYFELGAAREFIGDLAMMTSDAGTALIGISSMDPQYVSGASVYRLRPHLEEYFGEVEYLSAIKLGKEYSIGGQMGIFKCSRPKRKNQAV